MMHYLESGTNQKSKMVGYWNKCGLTMALLIFVGQASGQTLFTARLLSQVDSVPIPFAIVKLTDTGILTASNDSGVFQFIISDNLSTMSIEIAALNCRQAVVFERTGKQVENVYVSVFSHTLPPVDILGLPAKEIIKLAITKIPDNFMYTDYSVPVFYRQYHEKSGKYVFLVEAMADVLYQFTHYNKKITTQLAAHIHAARRSFNYEENEQPHLDHFFDLMEENPMYEPRGSVLNPASINLFQYSFEKQKNLHTYDIAFYSAKAYDDRIVEGIISVDRATFAIVSVEYNYVRKPSFPSENNVTADYKYRVQLVKGNMKASYQKINEKWTNKHLFRSYTYDYSEKSSYLFAYTLTENFEMYFGTIARPADARYVKASGLYSLKYKYDPNLWNENVPDYYFEKAAQIRNDLSKIKSLDFQFEEAGK